MAIHFNTTEEYVLEDERVLLRPLAKEDAEHFLHLSINDPELWKFSYITPGGGKENLENYINIALHARAAGKEYAFCVIYKKTKAYVGSTRFYDIQPDNQMLQLGYTWYDRNFWGTGLNKHCKFLLLQFAFEQMGMERVEFRADNNNERSIAAMKSIGCKVDGILRSNMPTREGNRRDSIVLSILKDEWFAEVKQMLKNKL